MSTKVYIAGKMSGLPKFNFPAFIEAAATMRALGFEVVSPNEQDTPEVQAAAMVSPDGKMMADGTIGGLTWGDILAKDVKLLADSDFDGIVFLPGWEKSNGAKLEAIVGLLKGFSFAEFVAGTPIMRDREWVKAKLHANL